MPSILHIYVAFDWGDEVDLEQARRLLGVAQPQAALARRRRTPRLRSPYSPPPLRYHLGPFAVQIDGDGAATLAGAADATLFDFGGVSVAIHVPINRTPAELIRLAGQLADSDRLVDHTRAAVQGVFEKLRSAISQALFSPLTEEYMVFQFPPGPPLPPPHVLLERERDWLSRMVQLESEPLSAEQLATVLQSFISYYPHDLFVPEWSAAVLIDRDCDETLQTIEDLRICNCSSFASSTSCSTIPVGRDRYRLIHPLSPAGAACRFGAPHARSLLPEHWANCECTPTACSSALSATHFETGGRRSISGPRVWACSPRRFHPEDWERSIQRSLEVVEGVYRVLSDQAATYRTEILEVIVIVLIVFELLMAILRH